MATVYKGDGWVDFEPYGLFRIPIVPETVGPRTSNARMPQQVPSSPCRRVDALSGSGLYDTYARYYGQTARRNRVQQLRLAVVLHNR